MLTPAFLLNLVRDEKIPMRFRTDTNGQLGAESLPNGTAGERPEPSIGDRPRIGLGMFANEAFGFYRKSFGPFRLRQAHTR